MKWIIRISHLLVTISIWSVVTYLAFFETLDRMVAVYYIMVGVFSLLLAFIFGVMNLIVWLNTERL